MVNRYQSDCPITNLKIYLHVLFIALSFFQQIFYVTNNSTKTRSQYLEKLIKLGFMAEQVG